MQTRADQPSPCGDGIDGADTYLVSLGAERIPHPGGTLMQHLRRVRVLLAEWGAGEEVQLAGLCHATYGTDGFDVALLDRGVHWRTPLPGRAATCAFAEITAANELDVVRHNPRLTEEHGAALARLMNRAARHLSPGAISVWTDEVSAPTTPGPSAGDS